MGRSRGREGEDYQRYYNDCSSKVRSAMLSSAVGLPCGSPVHVGKALLDHALQSTLVLPAPLLPHLRVLVGASNAVAGPENV
jgi:hypothetical protein